MRARATRWHGRWESDRFGYGLDPVISMRQLIVEIEQSVCLLAVHRVPDDYRSLSRTPIRALADIFDRLAHTCKKSRDRPMLCFRKSFAKTRHGAARQRQFQEPHAGHTQRTGNGAACHRTTSSDADSRAAVRCRCTVGSTTNYSRNTRHSSKSHREAHGSRAGRL